MLFQYKSSLLHLYMYVTSPQNKHAQVSKMCLFKIKSQQNTKHMYNEIKIAEYKAELIALWKEEPELQISMALNSFLNIFIPSANDKTPTLPIVDISRIDHSRIILKIRQLYDQCFSNNS